MGRPRGKVRRWDSSEHPDAPWFAAYRELREEIRAAPGLAEDFDAVVEMAKLAMRDDTPRVIKFLALKEVAIYTRPRMDLRGDSLPLKPSGELGGSVRKFLPEPQTPDA